MNKRIFMMALGCCIFLCNAFGNTASATKLEKFHNMLHSNKYMMVYTEQYLMNNESFRPDYGEVMTWIRDGENEYYSIRRDLRKDTFYHSGWLCVDGEYYQVDGEQKIGQEIKYRAKGSKSGIEKYPSDLGKSMLKNNHASQLIQLIYGGDDMRKLRYVGEGTLADGMSYEDYVGYFDVMGVQQDQDAIRYIFAGDELKKIISKSAMLGFEGVSGDRSETVEFEKFTDVIDTDCFQLPVTQKVYDSGIKDYYIAEE